MPSELSRGMAKGAARGDRVAIVAGLRTPFAKQQTAYKSLSAYDLGCLVVRELFERTAIDRREIGLVVYGQAVPSPAAPNIAREIVLGAGLPKSIEAFSVVRACATSFQAATSAAESILAGQHDVAIVGGADSASDVPITISKKLAAALIAAQKARSLGDKLRAFVASRPTRSPPGAAGAARAVDRSHHGRARREDGEGGRARARRAGSLRAS